MKTTLHFCLSPELYRHTWTPLTTIQMCLNIILIIKIVWISVTFFSRLRKESIKWILFGWHHMFIFMHKQMEASITSFLLKEHYYKPIKDIIISSSCKIQWGHNSCIFILKLSTPSEVSNIYSCAFNGCCQIAPDLSQCPYNKSLEVISPNTPNKPITLMDYRHFLK